MSRHLHLILYQAYADLRAEAARTYAGYAWWLVEPIIHMTIYYVVFGVFMKRATPDFVPFLLIGLGVWRWFHVTITSGAQSIPNNRRLMQQVFIPKIIFPSVTIITQTVKFSFVFAILLAFLWVYGLAPTIHYLGLIPLLLTQLLLIVALTLLMAAIMPFLPDLKIVLDNLLRGLMFLSGIFYSGRNISESMQFYFYLNPMAVLIDGYRDVLMYQQWPDFMRLGIIAAISWGIISLSRRIIRQHSHIYPRVVA